MYTMRLSENATTAGLKPAVRGFAIAGAPTAVADLTIAELEDTRRPKYLSDNAAALWEAARLRRARQVVQRSWSWPYLSETQLDRLAAQLAHSVRRLVAQIRLAALGKPAAPESTAAPASVVLVEALVDAACAPPVAVSDRKPEGLAA